MLRTVVRKSLSSDPRSRSIASLTVALVVRGPGVKSSLLGLIGCIFVLLFIAVAVVSIAVVDWGLRNHSNCLKGCGVDFLATKVSCLEDDILDRVWWHFSRILLENDKVRQFTGCDRAFAFFFRGGVCTIERPNFDSLIHTDFLISSDDNTLEAGASHHVLNSKQRVGGGDWRIGMTGHRNAHANRRTICVHHRETLWPVGGENVSVLPHIRMKYQNHPVLIRTV